MGTRAPRHNTTRAFGRTSAILTLAVSLCTAVVPTPAGAQVLIGMLFGGAVASENFNIGFEIGMNLSTVDGLNGASVARGSLVGLFGSWRFSEHYHLYTAVLPLSNKGAKDADPLTLNDSTLDPLVATGTMARDLSYLDIPVLLQLAQRRDGGFRIGIGPQVGILLSAKDRYAGATPQGAHVVVENDIEDSVQRWDAGVAFDTEYRFAAIPLAIGLRYYYGLTDANRGSGPALHNHVLSGSGRIALGVNRQKPPEPKQ